MPGMRQSVTTTSAPRSRQRGQRRLAAAAGLALVAGAAQRHGDDVGHALLVVDDQDARLHARHRRAGARPAGEMREAGAAAGALADVDAAAVRLDDLARDREAEAGAARRGGEERLEDARAQLGRHARAGVGDADLAPRRRRRAPRASTSPPRGTASAAFASRPSSTWLDQVGVGLDRRQRRRCRGAATRICFAVELVARQQQRASNSSRDRDRRAARAAAAARRRAAR